MDIVDIKTLPIDWWKPIIVSRYSFPPYSWIRGVTPTSCQALMGQELDRAVTSEKKHLLGCVSDTGDLLGFAQTRWMEWDTRHFGAEIWRLDHLHAWPGSSQRQATENLVLGAIQAVCDQGGESIHARVPLGDLAAIHALEGAGFRTVEVLTTWMFDLTGSSIPPKKHADQVRDFQPADTETLIELARTAYEPIPDRFHVDTHFAAKLSSEVYAEWIRNSCSGRLADHIAVATVDGEAVGYSTAQCYGDHGGLCNVRIAQLGLGAMLPEFRNRNLVADLIIHNLEWLKRRQVDYCLVGTQGNNIPPQRVWLRIGFKPAMMAVTLHYWVSG